MGRSTNRCHHVIIVSYNIPEICGYLEDKEQQRDLVIDALLYSPVDDILNNIFGVRMIMLHPPCFI